jgi:hypothetical protein
VKKSTKAVLLSGLVFPGLGHLYLKRWITGIVLSGITAFALYYIFSIAVDIAIHVSQMIESGSIQPDVANLTNEILQQLGTVEHQTDLASLTLLVCWVTGIVGSYWQGRSQDKLDVTEASRTPPTR